MQVLKNILRFILAKTSTLLGLSSLIRSFYVNRAKGYVNQLSSDAIQSGWIRRSVTNQDFIPFLSDVDLTLLVDEKLLGKLNLPADILVKDIQLIPESFLDSWLSAGGYRNYLQEEWIGVKGNLKLVQKIKLNDKSLLAFEMANEAYLLYHQLEKKMHATSDPLILNSRQKLMAELERLKIFWQHNDQKILKQPRRNFIKNKKFSEFIGQHDEFWLDLLSNLAAPLSLYSIDELIEAEFPDYYEMNLEMKGKQVLIVKNPEMILNFFKSHPHHFIVTENFFKLVKAVGVQEQDELNKLAVRQRGYYLDYNLQRLATDLVGAVVQFKEDHKLLYYCLKNIKDFRLVVTGKNVSGWEIVEENWQKHELVYRNNEELLELCSTYLEVLKTLR